MRTVSPARRPRTVRGGRARTVPIVFATGCRSAVQQAGAAASGADTRCHGGGAVVAATSGAPQRSRLPADPPTGLLGRVSTETCSVQ